MKRILALAAVLLLSASCAFAADTSTANTAAAPQDSSGPVPAVVSTGTENTIVPPTEASPAFKTLERVETIVFGSPREGGMLNRLNDVEKTVFGRELPGSLTERQTALIDFLERGTSSQPSLLFKLSVAEWAVEQQIHPTWGLVKRVNNMEGIVEGIVQSGPVVSRVERLLTKLLPDGVAAAPALLRKEAIVKCALLKTLTVRNVKKDDIIIMGLIEPISVNGQIVAPKGSRVFGHVTKVKLPGSFGRPAQIELQIDSLEVLGPSVVAVNLGQAAKKAMEADSGMIGAAGVSVAGAVLLGPLGLAGGFLIRGNDKQLKEGTAFYVQTINDANVLSYAVPTQITPLSQTDSSTPQGTQNLQQ